jgi:uncharacterized membrane protein YgcG
VSVNMATRLRSNKYSIFLSHSAADAALVAGIQAQLEAIGIGVYLYENDVQPGRSIREKLQQAIRDQDALVALLTPSSATRSFVHDEIGYALGREKPAVALVTPDVTNADLGMLEGEYIRLDPAAPLTGMARLLAHLQEQAEAKQRSATAEAQRQHNDELFQAIVALAVLLLVGYAMMQQTRRP